MTLLPASVADERFLIIEQIIERLQALNHESLLKIYYPQIVDQSALVHLAQQLNVAGIRGWDLANTEARQRTLIENAIELNRRAGTAYAILTAMDSVGYPGATITENPSLIYDGTWDYTGTEQYMGIRAAGFIVLLDPDRSEVSSDRISLLIAMINEWKNARSVLLDLRIGDISLLSNLLQYDGTWSYTGGQEYDGEKNL